MLAFLQESHRPVRTKTASVREWEGPLSAPLGEPGNVSWHPVDGGAGPTDELERLARQNTRGEPPDGAEAGGRKDMDKDKEELQRLKSRNKADRLVQG